MVHSGIRARHVWVPKRCDTRDTCIMQDTNDSADTKSARHGQFQEMEKETTSTTEINIFFRRILSTESNKTDSFSAYSRC